MASEAAGNREDVEQARRRFEEFRQAHAVRSRLPEELWATAAKLARGDGITATARVQGVDRPSLQKWTDRLQPRASTKAPKSPRRHRLDGSAAPAFVELLAASTATATSCVVEVESIARHGLPRIAADASPCRRDRVAAGKTQGTESIRGA